MEIHSGKTNPPNRRIEIMKYITGKSRMSGFAGIIHTCIISQTLRTS